jgi:RNA polymerase sigma factor (sigma-70 family)
MDNFLPLIKACKQQDRHAQKEIYRLFYSYGLTICCRYTPNIEEAKEVLNDAFLKVFTKLDQYNESLSFKGWVHRILVNTAIDYYRKHRYDEPNLDLAYAQHIEIQEDAIATMNTKEVLKLVQQLSPSYRIVFNLAVVEGYSHEEIAKTLNISEGTSKSNLARAKTRLQQLILQEQHYLCHSKKEEKYEGERLGTHFMR